MQLAVLGLNHKTADIGVRECFSFPEEQVLAALKYILADDGIAECAILSTCNRTEMYAVVDELDEGLALMRGYLQRMAGVNMSDTEMETNFYIYSDDDCIEHLFRVSASLDSLVVGEGQILSQVKKAYALAREAQTTDTVLNTLFHRAIAVGKKVRTETKIAYNAVSVSFAAVEMAKKVLGNLSNAKVLLVGAGQMSELTARHLVENGVQTVFVSNRKYERAAALAEKFKGQAVPFESFMKSAVEADIVITSTGAPHYIVHTKEAAHLMSRRQGKPILFIDIAVPRDVEPEVEAIAGVSLYNVDDLEAVVESNIKEREQEAEAAEEIIADELDELINKFRYLSLRPTVVRLSDKAERIRQREMKRALTKLPDITPEQKKIFENMSRMLVRKLLRDPMVRINEAAGSDKEEFYLKAARELFKLDIIGEEMHEEKPCNRYARQ